MGPVQSITTCWSKTGTSTGRASRSEFWWFAVCIVVIGVPTMLLSAFLDSTFTGSAGFTLRLSVSISPEGKVEIGLWSELGVLSFIAILSIVLLSVVPAIRRLHDADRAGWWLYALPAALIIATLTFFGTILNGTLGPLSSILLPLPILAIAVTMILTMLLWPSSPGPNRYGPNPHEVSP